MKSRLLKPLRKINNEFVEVPFSEVFQYILQKVKEKSPASTLFLTDGNLSNEELYQIQRLARGGVKSNALASFEYLGRGEKFYFDKNDIVPFAELALATHIFFFAFDAQSEHKEFQKSKNIAERYQIATTFLNSFFPPTIDYFYFFRAVNHYLLVNNLAKGIFIEGVGKNFLNYKEKVINENFQQLLLLAKATEQLVVEFIELIGKEVNPVLVYQEKYFSSAAIAEMTNFAMLTEIQTRMGSGLLGLKANNNSQGLFDMGFFPSLAPGGNKWDEQNKELAENYWQTTVCVEEQDVFENLKKNHFQNLFLFGRSKIETSDLQLIENIPFKVIQTFEVDETIQFADVLLPASYPEEVGGIYTDSTRIPRSVTPIRNAPLSYNNLKQVDQLSQLFGLAPLVSLDDIFVEYISFFRPGCRSASRHFFTL